MKLRRSPGSPATVFMCTVLGKQVILRGHQVILSGPR
jgi:hypothetical protein